MLDNADFASAVAPLFAELAAGSITQAAFITAYTTELNAWNVQVSTGALAQQVVALNGSVQTLLTQFLAIVVKGTVDTFADLPSGAPNGAAYIVSSDNHGYALIDGLWEDIGSVEGAAGDAAIVGIGSVTTGAPGSAASVTNTGTSSDAVLNFTIPQGEAGEVTTVGSVAAGHVAVFSDTTGATIEDGGAPKLTATTAQRWSPSANGMTVTLPFTPAAGSLLDLDVGGVRQWFGLDYTLSGTTVTFITGAGVATTDIVTARTITAALG